MKNSFLAILNLSLLIVFSGCGGSETGDDYRPHRVNPISGNQQSSSILSTTSLLVAPGNEFAVPLKEELRADCNPDGSLTANSSATTNLEVQSEDGLPAGIQVIPSPCELKVAVDSNYVGEKSVKLKLKLRFHGQRSVDANELVDVEVRQRPLLDKKGYPIPIFQNADILRSAGGGVHTLFCDNNDRTQCRLRLQASEDVAKTGKHGTIKFKDIPLNSNFAVRMHLPSITDAHEKTDDFKFSFWCQAATSVRLICPFDFDFDRVNNWVTVTFKSKKAADGTLLIDDNFQKDKLAFFSAFVRVASAAGATDLKLFEAKIELLPPGAK